MTENMSLASVRTRWQDITKAPAAPVLRIALLASYTIDPLTPYLGVALTDAGLAPSVHVAPFNQIVQQCLDDDSATARHRPDVLVVAPRLEDLVPAEADPAGYGAELAHVVDAACAAARRWRACLVVVLPAIPEHRAHGVLDDGLLGSVPAAAAAARERIRTHLAGDPGAWVVDAEQAVRAVGTGSAHHAALFRFARIPYGEAVFAELAASVAGVLRAVFGATPRAVVLDADTLGGDGAVELAESLRRAGIRLGLRASGDAGWGPLLEAPGLLDGWVVDDRPVRDQLADLAAALDVPVDSTVLLSTEPTDVRTVRLSGQPDTWPAALRRAGLLDRLPAPVAESRPAEPAEARREPLSLADFVAGLDVRVGFEPVNPDTAAKVAEVVSRAKDFTLGLDEVDGVDLDDPGLELCAVRVRDRFGQYGIGGAIGFRRVGGERVVEVFSLSCVVLGKGVQNQVLAELRASGDPLVVRYRRTSHNQVATGFLAAADPTTLRLEEVR